MKKVMRQVIRAFGFFAIYFGSQIATMMVSSIVCGVVAALRHGPDDTVTALEQTATEGQMLYMQNLGLAILISSVLSLAIFLIIFAARKVNPLEQADIRKISLKALGLTVLGGASAMLFYNFILDFLPIPQDVFENFEESMGLFNEMPLWQAIVGSVVLTPVLEEVVFRGFIFGRLRRAMPAVVAAILSSLVFGLMHGHPLWAACAFVFGMTLCYARMKTDSILPGIIMHTMANTFAVICNYSGILENFSSLAVLIILTVVGFIGLIIYFVGFNMVGKKEGTKERELARYAEEERRQLEKTEARKASEKESSVIL